MDALNPLFPDNPQQGSSSGSQPEPSGYALPPKSTNIQPPSQPATGANAAADLIREKLAAIYAEETDAKQEEAEVEAVQQRSKHQEFMYRLSTSGRSLADIQTEWHDYYAALPDSEKHEVWREFYEHNDQSRHEQIRQATPFSYSPQTPAQPTYQPVRPQPESQSPAATPAQETGIVVADHTPPAETSVDDTRSPKQIKSTIREKVGRRSKVSAKQNFQSLLFGIGTGLVVVVIFLFGFFNEVVIAPFIQPNRTASATPIIVDPSSVTVSDKPQIIIPKINVQIPVDYSQTTINEADIENALEDGVVHYPTTEKPGEKGNAAFFGHSSNNIFNKGKYKFAFVLLHELVPGDTFYLTYQGKVYIYKVIDRKIVDPTDVQVLDDVPGQVATATLITCDPPGTSLHRLVVVGQQISPDPSGNHKPSQPNAPPTSTATTELPGNGPTLWTQLWRSIF
ncbi:MAG TPA: sortase [Candidatus Saccharimonadales bacterium]|nr:sortase [Candidatus Saccharimonadales bacterium]